MDDLINSGKVIVDGEQSLWEQSNGFEYDTGWQFQPVSITAFLADGSPLDFQGCVNLLKARYPGLKDGNDLVYNPVRKPTLQGWFITGMSVKGCVAIAWIAKGYTLPVTTLAIQGSYPVPSIQNFWQIAGNWKRWYLQNRKRTSIAEDIFGYEFGSRTSELAMKVTYEGPSEDSQKGGRVIYRAKCRGEYAQLAFQLLYYNQNTGWVGWQRAFAAIANTHTRPGMVIPGCQDTLKLAYTDKKPGQREDTGPLNLEQWLSDASRIIADWAMEQNDPREAMATVLELLTEAVSQKVAKGLSSPKVL